MTSSCNVLRRTVTTEPDEATCAVVRLSYGTYVDLMRLLVLKRCRLCSNGFKRNITTRVSLLATFLDEQKLFMKLIFTVPWLGIMLALLVSLSRVVLTTLLFLLTRLVGSLQVNTLDLVWHLCLTRQWLADTLRMSTII